MGYMNISSVSGAISTHVMPAGVAWPSGITVPEAYGAAGKYSCSIKPEDLIDTTSYAVTYYVDGQNGNDSNSGLTWALRKKSIGSAVAAAITGAVAARVLVWAPGGPYYRGISICNTSANRTLTAPLLIEAVDGRVQTGTFDNLTWTLAAGQAKTYQATRSGGFRCINPAYFVGARNRCAEYKWVSSIGLCEAEAGTWYTDNTTCYVHPHFDEPATNKNSRIYINDIGASFRGNHNLFLRGFDFEGGKNGPLNFANGSTNTVVVDDCTMRYSALSNLNNGGTTVIDGAQILGCKLFAAFNSDASYNSKDGFNLHSEVVGGSTVLPAMLLVSCTGYENGTNPSSSNNGFTIHDGCSGVSIGCDWRYNHGTNSGHVSGGTTVWSVGDVAGGSVGDLPFGGAIDYGAFGAFQGAATLWLDSCTDIGATTGVYVAGGGAVYLRNHRGTGARSAGALSF